MPTRVRLRIALVLGLVGSVALTAARQSPPTGAQQLPPTFRSAVTAVPVDVRVVDRDGTPVTGLSRDDFAVFEDDVRQTVAHFAEQILVAGVPAPPVRAGAEVPPAAVEPRNDRIFLIVLGAGALGSRPLGPGTRLVPDPSGALDGLLRFLRERLLPQDQVALLAYNRATDFSSNHAIVASVLEALRESEEAGRSALARLSAAAPVQSPAEPAIAERPSGLAAAMGEVGFAEYARAGAGRTSDMENLYFGIRYLRFMPGEKHVVYLTAQGIAQPVPSSLESAMQRPWENLTELARAASNARVALHTIQTGGIAADPGLFLPGVPVLMPRILLPGRAYFGSGGSDATSGVPVGTAGSDPARVASDGRGVVASSSAPSQPGFDRPPLDPGVPLPGVSALGMEAWQELRRLAARTGGRAAISTKSTEALDRVDAETRSGYLLAYYPTNAGGDGRFRNIRVEVTRPGVTVRFRNGCYAAAPTAGLGPRAAVADRTLIAAASSTRQRRDIRITASSALTKSAKGKGAEVAVDMVIDAARLVWTTDELARRVTQLDLAVFCADAREKTVGQTRRSLTVALTDTRYQEIVTEGISYSVRIPLTGPSRFLKIVVFHYDANLVGSAVVPVK